MKDPFELKANSIPALNELFPDEESCIRHLEAINWHGKPVSPFDKTSKVYKLKHGNYRCKNTGKNFTVRTGTMFEKTKVSVTGFLPYGTLPMTRKVFHPISWQAI